MANASCIAAQADVETHGPTLRAIEMEIKDFRSTDMKEVEALFNKVGGDSTRCYTIKSPCANG